jgi:hypothetical protein
MMMMMIIVMMMMFIMMMMMMILDFLRLQLETSKVDKSLSGVHCT